MNTLVSKEWPKPESCAKERGWNYQEGVKGRLMIKGNSSILLQPRVPAGEYCYKPYEPAIPSPGRRSGAL